jgi:hypothetical protein
MFSRAYDDLVMIFYIICYEYSVKFCTLMWLYDGVNIDYVLIHLYGLIELHLRAAKRGGT